MNTDQPTPAPSERAYFALSFSPASGLVTSVRRFVQEFYSRLVGDADVAARVGLATHELLENACKYCARLECTLRVAITPMGSGWMISIRTRNHATPQNIERVQSMVRQLSSSSDAIEGYHELIASSLNDSEGSGLGLARINAESGMILECQAHGSELEIVATSRIASLGGAQ